MSTEKPRSPPPSGLFSDDSSSLPADERRSDNGPYRDARETLLARRSALVGELAVLDERLQRSARDSAHATLVGTGRALTSLGALLMPTRALAIVVLGALAGAGLSGASALVLTHTQAPPAAAVVVEGPRRRTWQRPIESTVEHARRRQKEGEALLAATGRGGPHCPIRRVAVSTWEVDEAVLFPATPLPPYATVEMRPHFMDGRMDGIQLLGVRAGDVQSQLGLEDLDVLQYANGIEILGADGVFAAAESAHRRGELELQVTRSGRPLTLRYRIVPNGG